MSRRAPNAPRPPPDRAALRPVAAARYAAAMPEPRPAAEPPADGAPDPAIVSEAIELALGAYEALCGLAETVEEEWTYVTSLAEVGRSRIRKAASPAVAPPPAASPGPAPAAAALPPDRGRAVRVAADEIRAITDSHRAIDWLSTFPAVVELALAPRQRG